MLKKILFFSFLIIIIPIIIVNIFIRNDEIRLNFNENSVVRVYRNSTSEIINVPLEEYVVGVVAGEMPVEFEIEALKAQAVAARTYVMKQMEYNINNTYDVVDTVLNQVYLDKNDLLYSWKDSYIDNINKIKLAVISTKGEYLTYNDSVAETLFFSTSVGKTENSEEVFSNKVDYLRSVDSHWDYISPAYESVKEIDLSDFYLKLELEYDEHLKIEVIETTSTGRIKKIKINDEIIDGNELCSKLALRSTFFDIVQKGEKVIIKNKGYGHGVGMSQYGANGMAQEGYKYDEILSHYYNGTKLKKI